MEDKVMKIFTVNKFYTFFVIVMLTIIIKGKEIIDIGYFIIVTYYFIKLKLHQRGIL